MLARPPRRWSTVSATIAAAFRKPKPSPLWLYYPLPTNWVESIADMRALFWRSVTTGEMAFGTGVQGDATKVGERMQETVRIGLDAEALRYPPSGIRAYVEALIAEYRNGDHGIQPIPLVRASSKRRGIGRILRLAWDTEGVAHAARSVDASVLHVPRFAAPRWASAPVVVTVHDLIPLRHPAYRSSLPARVHAAAARRYIGQASRVIVPTEFVAADVVRLLDVDPVMIDVIPMGVGLPSDDPLPRLVDGPYVIHTGGFDVRKNLPVLIAAFARASAELGPSWRLVLAGAPHTHNPMVYPPLQPVIEAAGMERRVILTGWVSEQEKQALYRHASLAVAPSLDEGFGLPILEAMSHGVPVIASNRTSHPEVAGDAALLVEPTTDALADAILRVAGDGDLQQHLCDSGRARAKQFPWSRTAQETAAAYRRALE